MRNRIVPPSTKRILILILCAQILFYSYAYHPQYRYLHLSIGILILVFLLSWRKGLFLTAIVFRYSSYILRKIHYLITQKYRQHREQQNIDNAPYYRHNAITNSKLLFNFHDTSDSSTSTEKAIFSPQIVSQEEDITATAYMKISLPKKHIDPSEQKSIPLDIFSSYLNRYGIRCRKIRITSLDSDANMRKTWISITVSAKENIHALLARSSAIPLTETTEATLRRLANHLQENGWDITTTTVEELPEILSEQYWERWAFIETGKLLYSAHRITVDHQINRTLQKIWSYPAHAIWTTLELIYTDDGIKIALCCLFSTVKQQKNMKLSIRGKFLSNIERWRLEVPHLPNLTLERGKQIPLLQALMPTSHKDISENSLLIDKHMINEIYWPAMNPLS